MFVKRWAYAVGPSMVVVPQLVVGMVLPYYGI